MTATILAFRRPVTAPIPAPRAPGGGTRPVVAALQQRVDVVRDGRLIVTDIPLGDLALTIGAIGGHLGSVMEQLARAGKAQVDDLVIRKSSTGGRAA